MQSFKGCNVLREHMREDGKTISLEVLKERYLRFTDELIGIIDGTIQEGAEPYDVFIYLDKSARPVSWLVNELWDDLARQAGTDFA